MELEGPASRMWSGRRSAPRRGGGQASSPVTHHGAQGRKKQTVPAAAYG